MITRGTGRPKDGYLLADGSKAPSVTEILGKFKPSQALIPWAAKLSREGRDYRAESAAAALWGTHVHDCMESYIHGETPAEVVGDLGLQFWRSARDAAQYAMRQPEVIDLVSRISHTELASVSEVWGFGGTFDALLNDGCVIDWKTSGDVYPDYVVQMGAYKLLLNENGHECTTAKVVVIHKSGDSPDYYCRNKITIANIGADLLQECEQAFLNLRSVYDVWAKVEKSLKENKPKRKGAK